MQETARSGIDPGSPGQHEPHPAPRRGVAGADAELHHVWPADVAGGGRGKNGLFARAREAVRRLKELVNISDTTNAGPDGRGAGAVVRRLGDHPVATAPGSGIDAAILETFRLRVPAWWILLAVLAAAFLLGHVVTVVLFGLISFWALREFITLTPTRPGDHRTLFWVFFLFTPLQFVLVGMDTGGRLYSIVIPVYAFLFIPARIALAGDNKRFLERTAKIQCGLLICVYCLSYAPALLTRAAAGSTRGFGGKGRHGEKMSGRATLRKTLSRANEPSVHPAG